MRRGGDGGGHLTPAEAPAARFPTLCSAARVQWGPRRHCGAAASAAVSGRRPPCLPGQAAAAVDNADERQCLGSRQCLGGRRALSRGHRCFAAAAVPARPSQGPCRAVWQLLRVGETPECLQAARPAVWRPGQRMRLHGRPKGQILARWRLLMHRCDQRRAIRGARGASKV